MPQPPQNFSVTSFEVLFPQTGTLDCMVCLTPQFFLLVYPHANVGPPAPPPAALPAPVLHLLPCCESSLLQLPVCAPPTSLDECFFSNSLVFGLPYSSIFWQFWLFLCLNLLLSFFWLCMEAKCIYLCLHLDQKSGSVVLMGC